MSLEDKNDFKKFIQRIYVNETNEKVYNMFVNGELIEKWYVKSASYKTNDGKKKQAGDIIKSSDEYQWEWIDGAKLNGKILEVDGKENLKFTFGNDVTVEIKLKNSGDRTLVELTQNQNIDDFEMRFDNFMACSPGWSFYLINLKSVCEGGIDLREKKPDIEMLVNV